LKRAKLIEIRKAKDISTKELKGRLKVCISTIEKVENGTRRASIELAIKWAEALNIRRKMIWDVFLKTNRT